MMWFLKRVWWSVTETLQGKDAEESCVCWWQECPCRRRTWSNFMLLARFKDWWHRQLCPFYWGPL